MCYFFFFNDTATTEIYTLSLHDALPIYQRRIEFPLTEGTPAKERVELEALLQALPGHGVPDTIAYLTESEIREAMPALEKLGYDLEGIKAMLQFPPQDRKSVV